VPNLIFEHEHGHITARAVGELTYPLERVRHAPSQSRVAIVKLCGVVPGRKVWIAPEGYDLARRVQEEISRILTATSRVAANEKVWALGYPRRIYSHVIRDKIYYDLETCIASARCQGYKPIISAKRWTESIRGNRVGGAFKAIGDNFRYLPRALADLPHSHQPDRVEPDPAKVAKLCFCNLAEILTVNPSIYFVYSQD
jgi:hypothetical protein